jgi:hypothetical protein
LEAFVAVIPCKDRRLFLVKIDRKGKKPAGAKREIIVF